MTILFKFQQQENMVSNAKYIVVKVSEFIPVFNRLLFKGSIAYNHFSLFYTHLYI